tara:strand:- start:688 stop:840 length:153 start_codon:yes stop_codon:yes gene_type:complete
VDLADGVRGRLVSDGRPGAYVAGFVPAASNVDPALLKLRAGAAVEQYVLA